MRAPLRIQTDVRPVSLDGQASPSSVYESPLGSASWAESVDGASPRVHRASRPTETTARAPSPPPAATSPLVATLPETLSPPAATSSPPRRFVPTPPRASTEQILVSPPAQVAGPSPLPTQVASPSPLPIQAPLPIQHMFPTTSPDLVPTRALSPLPRRLRHHTNASHPSDGSGSDEVVFRGSSSSASSSPAKRRRSHVRRHIGVNGDELARRTMSEGVQPKRASDAGGPRLSEARRTGQALMRRAQTGSGDDEEVSSDGREVVLFIPRAPPPPVPKVPTPPAVGAPSLPVVKIPTPPAAKVPTPPAVKVPTPPAVVVDPPVVRVVPVPPPLVRKESIPLPAASPYPGAAQFDYSPPRPEQLPRSVSPHTEGSFQSVHTADDVLRLPLDDWLEFAMSSMAAMGIPLTRATLEDLHESEDENSGGTLDGVSQADDDSDGDSPSLSLSPVSGMPSPARSGFFSATIPMPPNALRMPRPRLAPAQDTTSHHLARRFLQLDTDIRLTAAAGGTFSISQDDRPESPVRQYPWDAEIQHPRPRPAHGPNIPIRQLENVAKTKPKPTRSVSDPGDAHRLIAHFVRSNEAKARSNTVAVSDPSPASSVPSSSVQSTRETGRAFPFPSMTRHSTLENSLELESSANETGREDPLALKLGQILAWRAATATRTISRGSRGSAGRSSSRAGYGGATLGDLDKLAEANRREFPSPSMTPHSTVAHGPILIRQLENVQTIAISSSMSSEEIIMHLTEHGCEDLTRKLGPTSPNPQSIAQGGLGFVYREKLRDGRQVAIKALRVSFNAEDEADRLPKRAARELYTWSKCRHPNVLPLLGLANFQGQIRMVSLWMENGDLPSYLTKHPDLNRCEMVIRVCNGLVYLHHQGVIHGDFKGNNVLVSDEGIPMITDFGNAVLQHNTLQFTTTAQESGFTARWTAPEILEEKENRSKAADVYALGMTILEIITGKVPYFTITKIAVVITAIVVKKESPKRPEASIPSNSQHGDALWSLLKSCWEYEPEKRPDAANVAEIVKGITREGLVPARA